MKPTPRNLGALAATCAAMLAILVAVLAAHAIEKRSARSVRLALDAGGHHWAQVATDGLQVMLTGTAPSESARFRALASSGAVIDSRRVIDLMEVADSTDIGAPEYTLEILRNGDGISLIGLVPSEEAHAAIVDRLTGLTGEGTVTDMLETAEHAQPEGWQDAVDFGLEAMESLSRSKISVTARRVAIMAISNSASEKARIEADLRKNAPDGLELALDISAPRPVIAPFTLRFVADAHGLRFDACSANDERARDRILAAAVAAGMSGKAVCTIGLGVPSPDWAQAVEMGIRAVAELGAAVITFSDADISLSADPDVGTEAFDKAVGELESNLPAVFSLKAQLTKPSTEADSDQGAPVFTALRKPDSTVELRGRLPDPLTREAVESYARARFGTDAVYAATRLDGDLPKGWSVRVLAALESLGELDSGTVTVRADKVIVTGTTTLAEARGEIARILTGRLGEGQDLEIDVTYVPVEEPEETGPTPEACVAGINTALAERKIEFEPGSARIAGSADDTLDRIAELLRDCADAPIEIGGHTDSQGSEEMNLNLSRARAQAVVQALMARRILTGNLTAMGYGETAPVADNGTEAGRERNRRIEFRLLTVAADGTVAPIVLTPAKDTPRPKKRPDTLAGTDD